MILEKIRNVEVLVYLKRHERCFNPEYVVKHADLLYARSLVSNNS